MIYPANLRPGDKIAIISPGTSIRPEYVEGACQRLRREGFEPVVLPYALGPAEGSFAASEEGRLSDLREALANQEFKAILCSRGGYGCTHLLASDKSLDFSSPKWIVGFSDISALHALFHRHGIASLHASMCKHLANAEEDDEVCRQMLQALSTDTPLEIRKAAHPYDRAGSASGQLRGGNLAVLNDLAASRNDLLHVDEDEEVILFIEDVSEAIYAAERALYRLHHDGTLGRVKGLLIGRFTDYRPDRNYQSMEQMIDHLLRRLGVEDIPVAFDFPVGHIDENVPMIEGCHATLSVDPEEVILRQEKI